MYSHPPHGPCRVSLTIMKTSWLSFNCCWEWMENGYWLELSGNWGNQAFVKELAITSFNCVFLQNTFVWFQFSLQSLDIGKLQFHLELGTFRIQNLHCCQLVSILKKIWNLRWKNRKNLNSFWVIRHWLTVISTPRNLHGSINLLVFP